MNNIAWWDSFQTYDPFETDSYYFGDRMFENSKLNKSPLFKPYRRTEDKLKLYAFKTDGTYELHCSQHYKYFPEKGKWIVKYGRYTGVENDEHFINNHEPISEFFAGELLIITS